MKHKIKEVIVVEGRYDKNTVSQIIDAKIIETGGFQIFANKEKISLLKRLAEKNGLIILTDSDGAGFLIRNHLKGFFETGSIKHAYIPDRYGKEKRKSVYSKEKKLGVEGMDPQTIIDALKKCGATFLNETPNEKRDELSKTDMYLAGLTGTAGSAERRKEIMRKLDLPERLSSNGLLDVLNALYTREEFFELISE